jgi:hypothetical protein
MLNWFLLLFLMHLPSELFLNELCTIDQDLIFRGRNFFNLILKKKFFLTVRTVCIPVRTEMPGIYSPITCFSLIFFFLLSFLILGGKQFFLLSSQFFFLFRASCFVPLNWFSLFSTQGMFFNPS